MTFEIVTHLFGERLNDLDCSSCAEILRFLTRLELAFTFGLYNMQECTFYHVHAINSTPSSQRCQYHNVVTKDSTQQFRKGALNARGVTS